MKIKTKLTLGVGLLFLMIILLAVLSTKYIYALKSDTETILAANYNTLKYSKNMLMALDEASENARQQFENNLHYQEANITEPGEKEATGALQDSYALIRNGKADSATLAAMRKDIFLIIDMNMRAIQRKSDLAKNTANKAVFWIAITGTSCFLIAFVLLVNLPSSIANPLQELTQSIQGIAAENYSQRVHFEGHNEFGGLAKSFNTMAVKLEEYNNSTLAKLMIEKKRIETLINNMHDPVIGLDENLKIIFANEEAVKIAGLNHADLIGQPSQMVAINNDLIRTLIQDITLDENTPEVKGKPIKIYANNKEGYFEKDTLRISIVPTGEQQKKVIGHVIVLRNVTEYKELDFAKTNFIANVSHEFKTPIASIQMSLQLLENKQIGPLNEEQQNLVSSIQEDATRLLKITGELLNMTQVESGNIQLSILPSDPREIFQYAIGATQTQADQKHIRLDIAWPKDLPKVQADKEKTAWVLTNLISNAIRYSYDHSTIYLSIAVENNHISFSVKDTGQGIAPQYKDKIFDRYFRVPGTKKEGTGLGLAISKEFIEAQGGQISHESEFGAGSTFTITLGTLA